MHVVSRLGVQRRDVAGRALRLSLEDGLAPGGRRLVEGIRGRSRRRDSQLVEVEGGELRRHAVVLGALMTEARPRRDGKLLPVVQARVEKGPLAVHLVVGYVRVPVRPRSPARASMQVDAGEP